VEFVRANFSDVEVVEAKENLVLCSYNDALRSTKDDIVILLNNDIKVKNDFVDPLIELFKQEDVFLVSPKSYFFDGRYEGGKSYAFMRYGIFGTDHSFKEDCEKANEKSYTFASGCGAFNREKFLELGGYDDLYLPGRLEDADLCFRAWKSGYKCYYQPESVVYHKGAESFNDNFGVSGTLVITFRNVFFFMWKNISSPLFLLEHIVLLFPRLIFACLRGQTEFVYGFLKAIPLLPQALKRRNIDNRLLNDRDIFKIVD
ncbi:MAG TPA: glycosyltransferase, partial [Candidatus Parcubacteria bacterium]|nr:glycosyltransferase [Candidatus Parcubacteria bacterium]